MIAKQRFVNIITYSQLLLDLHRDYNCSDSRPFMNETAHIKLLKILDLCQSEDLTHVHEYDHSTLKELNPFTEIASHNIRTCIVAIQLSKELRLSRHAVHIIGLGALLHDIGKILVDQNILNKPSTLDPWEYLQVKTHSQLGYELMHDVQWLPYKSLQIIMKHHERLDGSGYPLGLTEHHLDLPERIVAISDVFDAITSQRQYREPLAYVDAIDMMKSHTPNQLDSKVLGALENVLQGNTNRQLERRMINALVYG